MITLNDLIKYAKVNSLDFDAPLCVIAKVGSSEELLSVEQIGTSDVDVPILIESNAAYDEKVFDKFNTTGVVNTMRFFDMDGNIKE